MSNYDITIIKSLLKHINPNSSTIFSPHAIVRTMQEILSEVVDQHSRNEIEAFIVGKQKKSDDVKLKGLIMNICLFYSSSKLSLSPVLKKSSDNNLLKAVNFKNSWYSFKKARNEINKAISKATEGEISHCYDKLKINSTASICIGSASIFKSKWRLPFTDVNSAIFYSNPPRQVDMMSVKERRGWEYCEGKTWTCLAIPFKLPFTFLYILLPKEKDGLQKLIDEFDEDLLMECTNGDYCEATASIPAFEIETCISLNDSLDLSHLFNSSKSVVNFFSDAPHSLDLAFHASKIKLNKIGAFVEDADVDDNFPQIDADFADVEFHADSPFIFFIASFEDSNLEAINTFGIFS